MLRCLNCRIWYSEAQLGPALRRRSHKEVRQWEYAHCSVHLNRLLIFRWLNMFFLLTLSTAVNVACDSAFISRAYSWREPDYSLFPAGPQNQTRPRGCCCSPVTRRNLCDLSYHFNNFTFFVSDKVRLLVCNEFLYDPLLHVCASLCQAAPFVVICIDTCTDLEKVNGSSHGGK